MGQSTLTWRVAILRLRIEQIGSQGEFALQLSSLLVHIDLKKLAALAVSIFLISAVDASDGKTLQVDVSGLEPSPVKMSGNPVIQYRNQFLRLSNGDDLVEVQDNGTATLSSGLQEGDTYTVEVINQPYLRSQICTVTEATGEISDTTADIITVSVTCESVAYQIGGSATGIGVSDTESPWLNPSIQNNAGEYLRISDGNFQFDKSFYWTGDGYSVTVVDNPPGKICRIDNWFGVVESNVTHIEVICEAEGEPREIICVGTTNELQDALSEAAKDGIDNQIRIQQGVYNGSFNFDSNETHSLTIEGGYNTDCEDRVLRPDATTLDGENIRRPLQVRSDGDVTIRHLTIKNGFHRGFREEAGEYQPTFMGVGGGLRASVWGDSNLKIESNIFSENVSHTDGGAAYLSVRDGILTITNNLFQKNLACPLCPINLEVEVNGNTVTSGFGPSGGAIWLSVHKGSRADLIQNTLVDNTAKTGFGGGIRVSMNADGEESYSRLYNNLFFNNTNIGIDDPEDIQQEGNDIWMQYDVGNDFVPQNPPVLVNNRFDDRDPEGIYTDFQFDVNLAVDPGFVDAENGQYELRSDSELVDAGLMPPNSQTESRSRSPKKFGWSNRLVEMEESQTLPDDIVLPETDLNGKPRIQGNSVDVGAFELQGSIFADRFQMSRDE